MRIKRRVEFDIAKLVGISSIKGLRHNYAYRFMVNVLEQTQVRKELNVSAFIFFKTCRGNK